MELLLNIVWALLAGTAIVVFLNSTPGHRKQFLLGLAALCCALLLLFPAISISDDLHFHAFVSEDSNPTKKLASTAHTTIEQFTTIVFVLSAVLASLFRVIGLVRIATAVPYLALLLERPILGRAPPSISAL